MTASATWRTWSCTVRLVTADEARLRVAVPLLTELLDAVDRAGSRFRDDSELTRANDRSGTPVAVSRLLTDLVSASLDAARHSDGLVDPTLGTALHRWGYDADIADIATDGPAPEAVETLGHWRRVRLDRDAGLLTVPSGCRLDLGASAKAYTADRAAAMLQERIGGGVLVELGGDVAVAGSPVGGWPIAIGENEQAPAETIALSSGGVTTSTTTVRRWRRDGRAVHHIIDPRTGRPAESGVRSASVVAGTALAANTASTAAVILGGHAVQWLAGRGLAARLVHDDGTVQTTPGWPLQAQRLAS